MSPSPASSLRAVALNCSLKSTPESSSTGRMIELISDQLAGHDVETTATFRIVDEGVRFGVTSDEGDGDGWPAIRTAILGAQILVLATPIWLGHPSSVCQMVLERLDAFISETDDKDRPIAWDRVAVVGVVGNEDGAHHVAAEVMQGLNDVGFTVSPAVPSTGSVRRWAASTSRTSTRSLPPCGRLRSLSPRMQRTPPDFSPPSPTLQCHHERRFPGPGRSPRRRQDRRRRRSHGRRCRRGTARLPPDRPLGVNTVGVTPVEEDAGESFAERTMREVPDPAAQLDPAAEQFDGEAEDEDDLAGQLVEPDASTVDHEAQEFAEEEEPAAGLAAEEQAMHIEDDDR
ncbi:MAG: NAD(P)H-dependent oxidoreductase [Ilumatobacteraceae bacterium]